MVSVLAAAMNVLLTREFQFPLVHVDAPVRLKSDSRVPPVMARVGVVNEPAPVTLPPVTVRFVTVRTPLPIDQLPPETRNRPPAPVMPAGFVSENVPPAISKVAPVPSVMALEPVLKPPP